MCPVDIKLGDDTYVTATHHGTISVQNFHLDALHTPTFRYSLLSVGVLDKHGYHTNFGNGKCAIVDPQTTATLRGHKNGNLYQVSA
ncbi:hypothetical protein BZA05DRAFT_344870, partial [Tricharina praecox]|uniref:uncharacterized protein n=1 Tax=Tricharina praecox TaxID=43433 RepID=UPI00221E45FC